jgi:hypothetical protein
MTLPPQIGCAWAWGRDGILPSLPSEYQSGGDRVSRWGDIIRARRERSGGGDDHTAAWGPWHEVASAVGIQVRVKRTTVHGEGDRELYLWSYEFKSLLPRSVGFRYKVHLNRDGPYDRLVRELVPREIASGSVILPTAGPIWIDAQLMP